jgi:magnesium chelatase family protein
VALFFLGGEGVLRPSFLGFCNEEGALGLPFPREALLAGAAIFLGLIFFLWLKSQALWEELGLALLFIGGLWNALERLWYHCVSDYLPLFGLSVFNLADGALTLGAVLFCLSVFIRPSSKAMPASLSSAATLGIESVPVEVEVDVLSGGLHTFTLVGLPDLAIRESRDRVSAAIKNSGFRPLHRAGRITVNLAPADLPKNSPIYDVPIALGTLQATGELRFDAAEKLFVGELALDGRIRKIQGILPIALFAKASGIQELYVPEENLSEAALVPGLTLYGASDLRTLGDHLNGVRPLSPFVPEEENPGGENPEYVDFQSIRGQEHAKRALEIAAAGGHNVLFVGPPGSGKTLLSRALPGLLPPLSREEQLEVTKIYSVAGLLTREASIFRERPFRAPHHGASPAALIGGGSFPRPGEISLAHRGVLFLDEFAEFQRSVLEHLRQPLESGEVLVSRVRGALRFPARFTLVAAMNPCPCGFAGDPERTCTCSPYQVVKYRQKISGPILDRIDLHVEVPRLPVSKLAESAPRGEGSARVRERVAAARERARARLAEAGFQTNAEMDGKALERFCGLGENEQALLLRAVERLGLSARGYTRVIKIARTIADLAGSESLEAPHIAEALQYRFHE